MEEKIQTIAEKIAGMEPKQIAAMTFDIAKKTKKKRLRSNSLFFKDYCRKIAEFIVEKESTKEVLQKYNLA